MDSKKLILRPVPAWAHGTSTVNLTLAEARIHIPAFDDRQALQEVLHRYCWGFDERRTDILAECFTEDGQWEAIVMGETTVGPFIDRIGVLEWLSRFWKYQKDQRRHMITNFIVEDISGDTASALAYLHLAGSNRAKTHFEVTGFYRLNYKKEDGMWKIRRFYGGFDAPFWKMDITEMTPELIELFGITKHIPAE